MTNNLTHTDARIPNQLENIGADFEEGYVLDNRFELGPPLGQGGSASVFEAMHLALREKKAVKILPRTGEYDETAKERFFREARYTVKLKHPNIVDVTDAGISSEGHRFIVMELLHGKDLGEWLAETPVEMRDSAFINHLIGILIDISDGLFEAHKKGFIHRDLKPKNIFLHGEKGEVVPKLLDFGIARRIDLDEEKLTITGSIVGTTDYLSPEQARGEEPDQRSDIFSMGVVLYESLTGQTPFGDDGKSMVTVRILDESHRVTPPSKLNSNVPRRLSNLVMKALERNPDDRFQTVEELSHALVSLPMFGQEKSTPVTDEIKVGERTRRSAVPAVTLAALLALIIGGFLLYRMLDQPDESGDEPQNTLGATASAPIQDRQSKVAVKKAAEPPKPESRKPSATAIPDKSPGEGAASVSDSKNSITEESRGEAESQEKSERDDEKKESAGADRQEAEALVRRGKVALANTEYEQATRLFNDAIDADSKIPEAWFGLARVAFETSRYDLALKRVNRALELKNHPRWRIFRGEIHLADGRRDAAKKEWQSVIKNFPGNDAAIRAARQQLTQIETQSIEK